MPANKQANIVIGVSSLLYFILFYHITRNDSWPLISVYILLFACYLIIIKNKQVLSFRWILVVALILRLIPFFSIPTLSDDFYRFIWDGRLWAAGINPFAGLPSEFLGNPELESKGITTALYNLLNSPTHYTVYPPIAQYINWLAAKLFSDSITYSVYLMRSLVILFDMTSLLLIYKILKQFKLKENLLVLYALNPLVIIELAGNLHHEVFMITFLLGFLLYASSGKLFYSAPLLALSVASKLLPLMFLPLIMLKQERRWSFLLLFGGVILLLFLPLLDTSFFYGMKDSLSLYYQNFEFNAGIYYLLRQIGFWFYGYNTIAFIGMALFALSTILILAISYFGSRNNASFSILFTMVYFIFAVLSLILHPWYILLLIALTPFTNLTSPIVWSFFIFLTYIGYGPNGFSENYYFVFIEFTVLFIAILYDWRSYTRSSLNLNEAP